MMDVSMKDNKNKNDGNNESTSATKRCTRSLTCRSHSFGAKRAVAGRSAPFDILFKALLERGRVRGDGEEYRT